MTARLCKIIGLFLALAVCVPSVHAQGKAAADSLALANLKAGNARFAKDKLKLRDLGADRREELLKGQKPFAIVVTSSDSRVVPEYIFDQGLGELYVLRIAGNVSTPGIIGSVEYAIQTLPGCALVVVMGHEDCDPIKAALGEQLPEGELGALFKLIDVGKDLPKDPKEALAAAAKNNAVRQGQVLVEKSGIIKEFVQSGRLQIIPAYYPLASGKVEWLDLIKLTGKHPAFIRVNVPTEDALVWLDDVPTKSRGLRRFYEIPAIDAAQDSSLAVKVQWVDDGKVVTETKTVTLKGGASVKVDFTGK